MCPDQCWKIISWALFMILTVPEGLHVAWKGVWDFSYCVRISTVTARFPDVSASLVSSLHQPTYSKTNYKTCLCLTSQISDVFVFTVWGYSGFPFPSFLHFSQFNLSRTQFRNDLLTLNCTFTAVPWDHNSDTNDALSCILIMYVMVTFPYSGWKLHEFRTHFWALRLKIAETMFCKHCVTYVCVGYTSITLMATSDL